MRISDWSSDVCSSDLVDRDREAHAHVAAGGAEDLRVDADHLAAHVEQRAAGVALVDGDVGLDERHVLLLRVAVAATDRADDAGGDRMVEAERRADRDRPLPRLERSEEHKSELQSLMRISYAVVWLEKKQ